MQLHSTLLSVRSLRTPGFSIISRICYVVSFRAQSFVVRESSCYYFESTNELELREYMFIVHSIIIFQTFEEI